MCNGPYPTSPVVVRMEAVVGGKKQGEVPPPLRVLPHVSRDGPTKAIQYRTRVVVEEKRHTPLEQRKTCDTPAVARGREPVAAPPVTDGPQSAWFLHGRSISCGTVCPARTGPLEGPNFPSEDRDWPCSAGFQAEIVIV